MNKTLDDPSYKGFDDISYLILMESEDVVNGTFLYASSDSKPNTFLVYIKTEMTTIVESITNINEKWVCDSKIMQEQVNEIDIRGKISIHKYKFKNDKLTDVIYMILYNQNADNLFGVGGKPYPYNGDPQESKICFNATYGYIVSDIKYAISSWEKMFGDVDSVEWKTYNERANFGNIESVLAYNGKVSRRGYIRFMWAFSNVSLQTYDFMVQRIIYCQI
jgi:uncharacterized protein Smg (DUF494 family)